jgi:hypothetical protein
MVAARCMGLDSPTHAKVVTSIQRYYLIKHGGLSVIGLGCDQKIHERIDNVFRISLDAS